MQRISLVVSLESQLSKGLIAMLRPVLLLSALAAIASPAAASNYSATLAAPASGRIVAREINWACAGDTCQGATQDSRPPVLCEALVKRAGRVESFLVDGRAFTSAELDRCNGSAKAAGESSVAGR
jgi:hypothetical protein